MIQLYQKNKQLRVLQFFFANPDEEFYLRELSRELDMSPMTVKRALDDLTSDLMLVREERKNQILYRANVEEPAFRHSKIAFNLAWLKDTGIVEELLEMVPGISSIVLYGSYARGENDLRSDLDILLISTNKKLVPPRFENVSQVEVNILNFTSEGWSKQARTNRPFYLDVITEGIVLHGTMPVV